MLLLSSQGSLSKYAQEGPLPVASHFAPWLHWQAGSEQLGKSDSRFPRFSRPGFPGRGNLNVGFPTSPRFPIPDSAGIGNGGSPRFPATAS